MTQQQITFSSSVKTNAIFSEDRKYRYALIRVWDEELPRIMFIGLNPSTADETQNDATIRRVIRFAKDWGYGGIYMLNLFAIVSKNPRVLKTCIDPIGENDRYLKSFGKAADDILFAWGSFIEAEERAAQVACMFPYAYCLGKNKNGTPKHPLYISANTPKIEFI